MLKPILTFSLILFLAACATVKVKQISPQVRTTRQVDFFAGGQTKAAFKLTGTMGEAGLEGVLVVQKIGAEDFEVSVMTAGAYRVMQATVTPSGIAYRYLFKDADTALVRGRINQFLNLLLLDPGVYQRFRKQGAKLMVAYKGPSATVHLWYLQQGGYPTSAQTITLLNTAELFYNEYAPADETGAGQIPHELIYQDGKLELVLTLISLK